MTHVRKTCSLLAAVVSIIFVNGCQRAAQRDESDYYYLTGNISATIPTNQLLSNGMHSTKIVLLNRVEISESFLRQKNSLWELGETLSAGEKDYSEGIIPFYESEGAVDLGMNSVPVLDQGAHGTCVTFATTALLDALLGNGDAISQQCTLALNKELGADYWNGAQHALQILRPLRTYGVVEKNKCPVPYPNEVFKIKTDDYQSAVSPSLGVATVTGNFIEPINLAIVKAALNNHHRIVLGFGIKKDSSSTSVSGFNMFIKEKHTTGGLWACQQSGSSTNYCGIPNSGHAVIVIGYDDNQQLLKIRNSWGNFVGDEGDYYMSYQFFELMSFNGTEMY